MVRIKPMQARAHQYGAEFAQTLRRKDGGWRKDTFALIRREFSDHLQVVKEGGFEPLLIWEYARVVAIAGEYLRHMQKPAFASNIYLRIRRDMERMSEYLREQKEEYLLIFTAEERKAIDEALRYIAIQLKQWDTEKARE